MKMFVEHEIQGEWHTTGNALYNIAEGAGAGTTTRNSRVQFRDGEREQQLAISLTSVKEFSVTDLTQTGGETRGGRSGSITLLSYNDVSPCSGRRRVGTPLVKFTTVTENRSGAEGTEAGKREVWCPKSRRSLLQTGGQSELGHTHNRDRDVQDNPRNGADSKEGRNLYG